MNLRRKVWMMVQWCTTLWERLWLVRYTKKLVSYIQIDLHRFIIRVASGNRVSGQITGHGKTDLWTKLSNDSLKRWHLNFQFYCKMTSNDSDHGPDIPWHVRIWASGIWGNRTEGDEPMWLLFRNRWIHHVMILKKETGELNICENLVFENGFR